MATSSGRAAQAHQPGATLAARLLLNVREAVPAARRQRHRHGRRPCCRWPTTCRRCDIDMEVRSPLPLRDPERATCCCAAQEIITNAVRRHATVRQLDYQVWRRSACAPRHCWRGAGRRWPAGPRTPRRPGRLDIDPAPARGGATCSCRSSEARRRPWRHDRRGGSGPAGGGVRMNPRAPQASFPPFSVEVHDRVFLVDDQTLVRPGIRSLLALAEGSRWWPRPATGARRWSRSPWSVPTWS